MESPREGDIPISIDDVEGSLQGIDTSAHTEDQFQLAAHKIPFFPGVYSTEISEGPKQKRSMPQRIYILFEEASESVLGKYISIVIMILIFLSVTLFIVESLPSMKSFSAACEGCGPLRGDDLDNETMVQMRKDRAHICTDKCQAIPFPIFGQLETMCVAVFTLEYAARFFTAFSIRTPYEIETGTTLSLPGLRRTWYFATRIMNCVDLLSVIPFYLALISTDSGGALAVLRIIRLMRIFRIFKLNKYSEALQLFANVMGKSSLALYLLFFFMALGMIIFGSLLFYVEEGTWDPETGRYMRSSLDGFSDEETPFVSIPHTFWWVIVTMTTVGYGDVSPTTPLGQLIGVLTMLTGILCLALPITVIGANFAGEYEMQQQKTQKNLEMQSHVRQMMIRFVDLAIHKELRSAWSVWVKHVYTHRIVSGDDAASVVEQLKTCLDTLNELTGVCRDALEKADSMLQERLEYKRALHESKVEKEKLRLENSEGK